MSASASRCTGADIDSQIESSVSGERMTSLMRLLGETHRFVTRLLWGRHAVCAGGSESRNIAASGSFSSTTSSVRARYFLIWSISDIDSAPRT